MHYQLFDGCVISTKNFQRGIFEQIYIHCRYEFLKINNTFAGRSADDGNYFF